MPYPTEANEGVAWNRNKPSHRNTLIALEEIVWVLYRISLDRFYKALGDTDKSQLRGLRRMVDDINKLKGKNNE